MKVQSYIQKHLFGYMKRSYRMLLVILIIDLIPLYGVLFLGWGTMDSVYLYFFETIIIGAVTFFKMSKAKKIFSFARWQNRLGQKAVETTGKAGQMATSLTQNRFGCLRSVLLVLFTLINIPICILLMMLMLGLEGKGFSLGAIFGYDGGHTDLFVMTVNTFYIMIALLTAEHLYTYFNNYIKNKEYEKAGMLNEALSFELRVIIQSIVMIGGVALIFFFDFSKVMVIILIVLKTLIDLFVYLRNRYWSNVVEWIENEMDKAEI